VTIVEDRWHVTEVTHYITSRFGAGASGGEPDSGTVRRLSAGYVAIRFDDPVFVSWDHRKLAAPRSTGRPLP
jgi:hypothetical protein